MESPSFTRITPPLSTRPSHESRLLKKTVSKKSVSASRARDSDHYRLRIEPGLRARDIPFRPEIPGSVHRLWRGNGPVESNKPHHRRQKNRTPFCRVVPGTARRTREVSRLPQATVED